MLEILKKTLKEKFKLQIACVYSGLKCDNPDCDWLNPNISFEEYESYIGRPCPKCGWNLLTEKTYQRCKEKVDSYDKVPSGQTSVLISRKYLSKDNSEAKHSRHR